MNSFRHNSSSSNFISLINDTCNAVKTIYDSNDAVINTQGLRFDEVLDRNMYHDGKSFYKNLKEYYNQWDSDKQCEFKDNSIAKFDDVYNLYYDEKSRETFNWLMKLRLAWILTNSLNISEKINPYPIKKSKHYYKKELYKRIEEKGNAISIDGYDIDVDVDPILEIWIHENYQLDNIYEPRENDVIIDGGAYLGESSIWYAHKMKHRGKIYAFECVKSNVERANKNVNRNHLEDVIEVVENGLWYEDGKITIEEKGYLSHVNENNKGVPSNVVSLDSFIEKNKVEKVNLIKLDLEGVEIEALKGAERTIKKFSPDLTICVYHAFYDIADIPLYLKSIKPDYKFYLSHKRYTPFETVLFAKQNIA